METKEKQQILELLGFMEDSIDLYGEYIRKFISLGVKYSRTETLELAEEFMDKHKRLKIINRK